MKTTKQIAKWLKKNNGGAVLLCGDMGAGKTTLVSAVMKYINKNIKVSSPTYTIINKYSENIYHADLYRLLQGTADLQSAITDTGLYDLLCRPNIVFVEWANDIDISDALKIQINIKENGKREYIIY